MLLRETFIRFDWAIKRILRDKENFGILEGFLSELLGETVTLCEILESEADREPDTDRHNRVDILVKNARDEFVIIEVQNHKEYDYFRQMLYGTSKAITHYIRRGTPYAGVKKVVSIMIAYFDLIKGGDYVYHGTNRFVGIHQHDELELTEKQKELYLKNQVHDIFPEYWIIKVDKFNNKITNGLDEWIYFLRNSEIPDDFSARGIREAKEKLAEMRMAYAERVEYHRFLDHLMDIASEKHTEQADFKDRLREERNEGIEEGIKKGIKKGIEKGLEIGIEKGVMKVAIGAIEQGFDNAMIASFTELPEAEIEALRPK